MLLDDLTTAADLAYRAHLCACATCKRVANRAAERLRSALTFARACEAFSAAVVVRPKPLLRQASFAQKTMFLDSSVFCAALGVCSSN